MTDLDRPWLRGALGGAAGLGIGAGMAFVHMERTGFDGFGALFVLLLAFWYGLMLAACLGQAAWTKHPMDRRVAAALMGVLVLTWIFPVPAWRTLMDIANTAEPWGGVLLTMVFVGLGVVAPIAARRWE